MKKAIKIAAVTVLGLLAVLQFFRVDRTNPQIVGAETLEAVVAVPADIAEILGRSCNDCHSHKTVFPWYTNIQPAGWFMKDHVDHGRSHLNFSIFNSYDAKKRAKKLEEICDEVSSGRMPLPSYLWLHGDAVLSGSDGKALCDWAEQERKRIEGLLAAELPK